MSKRLHIRNVIILFVLFGVIAAIMYKRDEANTSKLIDQLDTTLVEIPNSVKCMFEEDNCQDGDLTGWSIIYFFMFFLIGLFIPDYYFTIIIVSLLIELGKHLSGQPVRYIIYPLLALTAYALGSILTPTYCVVSQVVRKYQVTV